MTIPVFRIFDRRKAIEFYIDWLGFKINWEYSPENSPAFIQISMRDIVIELSEHHGDGTPGSIITVDYTGLKEYQAELIAKNYTYMRPGIQPLPWNEKIMTMNVIDPFLNRIQFHEKISE